MSRNKLLERDTNKITVVLAYAVVEWILILLLLLNSVFSYLIIKYAEFFGVERPCPCCTRLDHIFDQSKIVCEAHANQISKLGYCSNHRNLAPSQDMCHHCLSSTLVIQNKKEKVGELSTKCCCCGARLDRDTTMYSSYLLLESSCWYDDVLERIQKHNRSAAHNHHIQQGSADDRNQGEEIEELEAGMDAKEESLFLDLKDNVGKVKDQEEDSALKNRSILDHMELLLLDFDINVEPNEDQNSLFFHAKHPRNVGVGVQEIAWEMHLDVHTASASEQLAQMDSNENEADVSIGTEIPDIDDNEREDQESFHSYKCTQDRPSTSSPNLDETDDQGLVQVKEQVVEFQCLSSVQDREHILKTQPPFQLELNEIEEDEVPNTPASVDSPNQFHRNLVFLEKRDTVSEESLDGSVTSELEGGEGVVTIESLKSALRAERKTLQALYAELEEERSASAEAANQTMAMINRLQEEKAAMQMEAFQYQRMMEEQSEYDQEALQLMNDVIVKREKENQELEKELEAYRKKLLHHETKTKMRVLKKSNASTRSGVSSATCSINAEDSDGLSIDLNQEATEEEGDHNTPVDTVMNLEESLADFDEDRLSILAELKVLEEKLMLLDEENGIHGDGHSHLNGHSNGFDSNGVHNCYVSKFESESKKVSIEAEVDHLYERLQGLEADREFIKHCVSSLRKGDRGMELLQEILQHVRDLHNIELHVRNLSDSALIDS